MSDWSISQILSVMSSDIQHRLEGVRRSLEHPGTKGDASESVWLRLLQDYLPKRYQAESAHVVDSAGKFSEQIDVLIFDRQYSPFLFHYEGKCIVPAESVYAAFEAKQSINVGQIRYAQKKIASVRCLYRTSLPIPHAGGTYPAKEPAHIFGGLLTTASDWNPALGKPLSEALIASAMIQRLDLGCVADHGYFARGKGTDQYNIFNTRNAATSFLFKLISELQSNATVPMIDIDAYAQWLNV